ncbi:hypothetical protein [Nonomuraea candida]|uniref:hypothetical protein n=1 Tax=Nonomuraea candida TaxID=359159 RepID=UPI000AD6F704|nr:hypothetical protein [Nonomuraea candida]
MLARARLVYGEWLRRENPRTDAREQLGLAYEALSRMGAEGILPATSTAPSRPHAR